MSQDKVKQWRDLAARAMEWRDTEQEGKALDDACDYIRTLENRIALLEEDTTNDRCIYCGAARRECEACTGGHATSSATAPAETIEYHTQNPEGPEWLRLP